jgi:hypothetical protein
VSPQQRRRREGLSLHDADNAERSQRAGRKEADFTVTARWERIRPQGRKDVARTVGETRRSTVAGEAVAAFIPDALPPAAPPLALEAVSEALSRAEHALARLELAGEMVPSLDEGSPRRLEAARRGPA